MRICANNADPGPRLSVLRRCRGAWRARKGIAQLIVLVLTAGVLGTAYAERHSTVWRNSSNYPYTVTRVSYGGCVTDAGPSLFTVARGRVYGAELTVGTDCNASVQWRIEQQRPSGTLVATIAYSETADHEGLWGFVLVALQDTPGKAQHYFQAQCGTHDTPAYSCLGRFVKFLPPTTEARVAFNVLASPAEVIVPSLTWQPIRK